MNLSRRPVTALVASVLLGGVAPLASAQQPAPLPAMIRIVVPAAPGSSTDAFARAVAQQLGARTGSNVIVENKAGASTMLGSAAVAKGPKDGSMLLINSTTLVSTAATMKEPPLDVVRDLVPVALLEQNPLVTSAQPLPAFPGMPTMASVAPGFSLDLWLGIFAPTGTPAPVVQRLNREIVEIARGEKLREMMAFDGGTPVTLSPQELAPMIRDSVASFRKLAAEKNIVAE